MSKRLKITLAAGTLLGLVVSPFASGDVTSLELTSFNIGFCIGAVFLCEVASGLLQRLLQNSSNFEFVLPRMICFLPLAWLLWWSIAPMFGRPTDYAKKSQCMSNLKQTGIAFLLYSDDFDVRYPPAERWMDAIEPHYQQKSMPHCPELFKDGKWTGYGYAMSRYMSGKPAPEDVDLQPLAFESTLLGRNESEFWPTAPMRHPKTPAIVLFTNGHVSGRTATYIVP